MEYGTIEMPALFIENLISDTWEEKISWDTHGFDYGLVHMALLIIPKTMKYLKVEVFDIGYSSFIKTEFHTGKEINRVEFSSITRKQHPERFSRLTMAIKRYQDANNKN